ncbi:DUF6510 family protein [Streptomyces aurantiogriseus]|uniref:DUF6510 family protein n=1 Tax=Streptomyces aurantiogriseus TaxID=66870 RepID=UPI003570B82B
MAARAARTGTAGRGRLRGRPAGGDDAGPPARSGPLAELHVYGPEPGLTAVCPGCAHVALRLVREERYVWLTRAGATARSGSPSPEQPPTTRPGQPPSAAMTTSLASSCTWRRWSGPWNDSA